MTRSEIAEFESRLDADKALEVCRKIIRTFFSDCPDATDYDALKQLTAECDRQTLQNFTRYCVMEQIAHTHRMLVASIERASQVKVDPICQSLAGECAVFAPEGEVYVKGRACLEDFKKMEALQDVWDPGTANPRYTFVNRPLRDAFREWMGERFGEWQERARMLEAQRNTEYFAKREEVGLTPQAHPYGPLEQFEDQWDECGVTSAFDRRRSRWLREDIQALLEQQADNIRLELTTEFLSAQFAIGDGRTVSWGDATVEDHLERIELLKSNAAGNMLTASRHLAAIRTITAQNAECLGDIAKEELSP